jgi:predicted ATP-binding protein involved in virulence
MIIKSIELSNFRCFEKQKVGLDDRLTVFIGPNGSGKTAILESISLFLFLVRELKILNSQPIKPDKFGNDFGFGEDCLRNRLSKCYLNFEINMPLASKNHYIELELKPYNNQNEYVHRGLDLTHPKVKNFHFDKDNSGDNYVFVFYFSNRIIAERIEIRTPINYYTSKNNPSTPYRDYYYNIKQNYQETLSWYCQKSAEEAIKAVNSNNLNYKIAELEAIRKIIPLILGDIYSEPKVFNTPAEIYLEKKGDPDKLKYNLEMLSSGYKDMLVMAMDLARRMAVANPAFEWPEGQSFLDTPAIVLIDEVELHLHPGWQQTILPTLLKIFPKTQFIVTTHSPQVLSSIPSRHIRILKDNGVCEWPDFIQTEGAEAGRLLKSIFEVDQRPVDNEFVKKLKRYEQLVAEHQIADETEVLRKELYDHFGDNEPRLFELDLYAEHHERLKEIEKYFEDE